VQLRQGCVVMSIGHHESTNVVAFRQARPQSYSRRNQKHLMEAVYSAGSLPVAADDRESKAMAARLLLFGFVVIDEIDVDGAARRLRSSEAVQASLARPWRVSKPSVGRKGIGVADAGGYLAAGEPIPGPLAG
jgi:hypothetical protein